ncbi:serine/threonine protein kinase [Marasmius sp. AFHP31]|nr:serine/threonine protein kinase [Marasmius sp. AFHP31]
MSPVELEFVEQGSGLTLNEAGLFPVLFHLRRPDVSLGSESQGTSTTQETPIEPDHHTSFMAGRVSVAKSPTIDSSHHGPSSTDQESFLGSKRISDFHIEGEIGRGAYGIVKRGREIQSDGSLGPPVVIKLIIKSRILADCWKKDHELGMIPTEIYIMSAISEMSHVLPPRRPWDPLRFDPDTQGDDWVEAAVVKGHPNICPLLDFFEDSQYYYIVLPGTTPEPGPNEPQPNVDLFDIVETFPNGLPPGDIRTYLGGIADALMFLHAHGIVHRDVKDENVVLGADGRAILIDFGSAGFIKRGGFDSFSGTLDYAGPEILRGEQYQGKEQDVWAFGVVAFVLLVGECPFMTAAEAQEGLSSPFANATIALDERCSDGNEFEGQETDGGGALGDAAALVRACLQVDVPTRPTFEKILQSRFLVGNEGWGMKQPSLELHTVAENEGRGMEQPSLEWHIAAKNEDRGMQQPLSGFHTGKPRARERRHSKILKLCSNRRGDVRARAGSKPSGFGLSWRALADQNRSPSLEPKPDIKSLGLRPGLGLEYPHM